MKAQRGAKWRWVVNATFQPLYPRERDAVLVAWETEWARFDPRTVQRVARRYADYAVPARYARGVARITDRNPAGTCLKWRALIGGYVEVGSEEISEEDGNGYSCLGMGLLKWRACVCVGEAVLWPRCIVAGL